MSSKTIKKLDGTDTNLTLEQHLENGGENLFDCDLSRLLFENLNKNFTKYWKISGSDLSGTTFRNCELIACVFVKNNLHKVSFIDCHFYNIGPYQVGEPYNPEQQGFLHLCTYQNTLFENCSMVGLMITGSFNNTSFVNCDFSNVSFFYVRREMYAQEHQYKADLSLCEIKDCLFNRTVINEFTQFPKGYNLANFSKSSVVPIDRSDEEHIKGCTITMVSFLIIVFLPMIINIFDYRYSNF